MHITRDHIRVYALTRTLYLIFFLNKENYHSITVCNYKLLPLIESSYGFRMCALMRV